MTLHACVRNTSRALAQSNQDREGIVGPGAEWHNDGSFLPDVFSHAGYHIGCTEIDR